MKTTLLIIIMFITLLLFINIALSQSKNHNQQMVDGYMAKLSTVDKTATVEQPDEKFLSLYKDLKQGANAQTIRQLYAQNLYFNDTFNTLDNIDDLITYLTATASKVKSTTVTILDTAYSGTDYYIRWEMVMEFKAKGKNIYSKSIGMSQLRFDAHGKIIFHQDFWDSTEGFYQHLPYIGYFIKKIRHKL